MFVEESIGCYANCSIILYLIVDLLYMSIESIRKCGENMEAVNRPRGGGGEERDGGGTAERR